MNLKRRAVEGVMVAGSLIMMSAIAETANTVAVEAAVTAVTTKTDYATGNGTAGVVVCLDEVESSTLSGIEMAAVEIEQTETMLVAASEELEEVSGGAEEALSEEEMTWQNRLMANVEEFLYVRAAADENAEIVGKLYKGAVAEIVEPGEVWTHITSGNVDGYVNNAYCVFGTEALQYAESTFDTRAEVQTNGLRVRSEADAEASVITAVSTGTTLVVDTETETPEEWVAVEYGGSTAYVSAEYVSTELALTEGVTIAEEKEALAKAAAEEAARKAAQVTSVTTVQNTSVAASVDEVTLLAALIQCEAGNECYEGQLAVGAVVMNRVRSGGYPGSIYDVIYQKGQFPPAGRGSVASIAANGPKGSCMQAAQEALNGMDNTGGARCFARASSGHAGVVIGNHVFY